jgi:carbon monoxide dehydrogenase subunit G
MNVHGSRLIQAPRQAVFDAVCDPETLLAVIPGCRAIERHGDEYQGRIELRLPGFSGSYRTVVHLVETDPPSSGRMEGSVVGAMGSISGQATFTLTEVPEGTTVTYGGSAVIDGPLARLDGRFAEGLAGSLIGQGLGSLGARLRTGASQEQPSSVAAEPRR